MLSKKQPETNTCPVCETKTLAPTYMTKTIDGQKCWHMFCKNCSEYVAISDSFQYETVTCDQRPPKFNPYGPTRDLWIDTPFYIFQVELVNELKYRMKQLSIPESCMKDEAIMSKKHPKKEDLEQALEDTIENWKNHVEVINGG